MGWTRDKISKHIAACGSESLSYGFPQGPYKLLQDPTELMELTLTLQEVDLIPSDYLEIGVAAGGLARYMTDILPLERVTLIDDGKHRSHKFFKDNLSAMREKGVKVDVFIGDSHSLDAHNFLSGKAFDLAMIDGDHSYDGAMADVCMACEFMRPGSYVIVHDSVYNPDVKKLVGKLDSSFGRDLGLSPSVQHWSGGSSPGVKVYAYS